VETFQIYLNNRKEDLEPYPGFSFASAKANDVELPKALRGGASGVGRNYRISEVKFVPTTSTTLHFPISKKDIFSL
jgi:hypothetical protein